MKCGGGRGSPGSLLRPGPFSGPNGRRSRRVVWAWGRSGSVIFVRSDGAGVAHRERHLGDNVLAVAREKTCWVGCELNRKRNYAKQKPKQGTGKVSLSGPMQAEPKAADAENKAKTTLA